MAGNAALVIVAIGLLFLLLGGLVFVVSRQADGGEKKAKSETDTGAEEVRIEKVGHSFALSL
jgi:hypothetical protein